MPNIQLEAQPRRITITIARGYLPLFQKAAAINGFSAHEQTEKTKQHEEATVILEKPIGYNGLFNPVGDTMHNLIAAGLRVPEKPVFVPESR